jgi:Zn-dependent peptidase ImmA (M78 family)
MPRRKSDPSLSAQQMEDEANRFACELLMPYDQLMEDIKGVDLTDDAAWKTLASKYQVPVATMALHVGILLMEDGL